MVEGADVKLVADQGDTVTRCSSSGLAIRPPRKAPHPPGANDIELTRDGGPSENLEGVLVGTPELLSVEAEGLDTRLVETESPDDEEK
jgi:hypothetical protein